MDFNLNQDQIIVIVAIASVLIGFLLTPSNVLREVFALIEKQVDVDNVVYTLKTLNEEYSFKKQKIEDLSLSIVELESVLEQMHERIKFVSSSGELQKLEDLEQQSIELKKLQTNIKSLKGRNEQKFNMAALISLVQSLYLDLYNQEISVKEVANLLNSGFGGTGVGGFGMSPNMDKPKSTPKM
jgi:uncharacterized coiled-coil protein SlyX